MHTTTPDDRRPGDRSGAVWVTATGALLLLAAATTFVAVRWDQLHDWQKFAALVVVTQCLLVGGWLGRARVPATAAATFSLGAVLVPLDAWTVAASGTGDWERGLFVGGGLGVLVLPLARRFLDTIALRWAWVVSVPIAAAGTAAFVGFPPPGIIVAALGLLALSADRRDEGITWLVAGALAPIAALAAPGLPLGDGVIDDLGLTGPVVAWTTAATAVLVIAALVINGRRLASAGVVATGVALAAADLGVALHLGDAGPGSRWLTAAVIFLMIELTATAGAEDRFWSAPTRRLAQVAEAGSLVALLGLAQYWAADSGRRNIGMDAGTAALCAAFAMISWLLADHRAGRARGRWRARDLLTGTASLGHSLAATSFATLALAVVPVAPVWLWLGITVVGATLLVGRRSGGSVVGVLLLVVASFGAVALPPLGLVVAAFGVLALALGARRQGRDGAALLVSMAATATLGIDALIFSLDRWTASSGTILLATAVAGLVLGSLGSPGRRLAAAPLPWSLALVCTGLAVAPPSTAWISIAAPAIALIWFAVETLRRGDPIPPAAAAVAGTILSSAFLLLANYDGPQLGVGLAVVAVVLVGLALTTGRLLRTNLYVVASCHLVAALGFAAQAPGPLGIVLTIAGLLAVAVAIAGHNPGIAYNGIGLALLGTWQTLFGYEVGVAEAYLAPLALVLLLAGWHGRTLRPMSSWIAYTPPVLTLGGGAIALRLAGAPGWHGVIAGAVAVVAVAAGAWQRLAGPLFVGSALLAVITVNETLSRSAGVPTWMWLALGGCVLLGAGVTMELRGLGPIESGRRVVDLVAERFD